jgi:Glyoxalase-like domain
MNGITDPEDDPTVVVEAPGAPRLFFQLVPEPKAVKNRVHLDLGCNSFEAEVARLTALGAASWNNMTATSCYSTQKATSSACHGG